MTGQDETTKNQHGVDEDGTFADRRSSELKVPEATVARLAIYLRVLNSLAEMGVASVSSQSLSAESGVKSATLRKDLSYLGPLGVRGVGYDVVLIASQIQTTLGLDQNRAVALIGVGHLGQALAGYAGFVTRGFRIAALLDIDPATVGTRLRGLVVQHVDALAEVVRSESISMAVIAVPARAAQPICDRLVAAGVTSILNFAPCLLVTPAHVDVRKVDLAAELQILSFHDYHKGRPIGGHWRGEYEGSLTVTLLVVGLSHHSAPVSVLERVSIATDEMSKLLDELQRGESISEVMALSTCNRIEVYADVDRFHPAVADISAVLARIANCFVNTLGEYLYVQFAEGATEHLFQVAAGLDSMVVGESQILGQLRGAYALGTAAGTVGPVLHDAIQNAMRVGKRVHSETGIDRAAPSVVSVGLAQVAGLLAPGAELAVSESWSGVRVVILGAGSMGALAGASLRRQAGTGVEIVVINRSFARAGRLADNLGGRAAPIEGLAEEIRAADVLISSTGATGLVLGPDDLAGRAGKALVVLDLAMPRDVDPAVAEVAGVAYIDLEVLRSSGAMVSDAEVHAATTVVADELAAFLRAQHALAVAPTVTALRARAAQVVDAELLRLDARMPGLNAELRAEVATAVRRAVDKVLHAPTVRVKELAATPEGDSYAAALRMLFDLDPAAAGSVAAVRNASVVELGADQQ